MTGITPSLKNLIKSQSDAVLETQWLFRGWLGSTGHLQGSPVPPNTTLAAFSSLWFWQSWMFEFKLSMLEVRLQAELLFVVRFPPSNHLAHLSWPDKYLKEEKSYSPHFLGLGLSNTEETLSISIAPQKEWKHLENVRKEVLGEAKNCYQVSQAKNCVLTLRLFAPLLLCYRIHDFKGRMGLVFRGLRSSGSVRLGDLYSTMRFLCRTYVRNVSHHCISVH